MTFVNDVRSKAKGHWEAIFQRLDIPTNRSEGECPSCGGKTRYRFDDREGRGTYHCSHCGAGTGLDLVMKVNQCDARSAAEKVAGVMALPLPEPKPAREKPQSNIAIADKVAALVAKTVSGESQYLLNKGLPSPAKALLSDGSLLLVLQTMGGTTTGAQLIGTDGSKRLLAGTTKKGSFIPVRLQSPTEDEQPVTVLIAEGYATGVTVSLLDDGVVLAALDEGNLIHVAKVCRAKWPLAKIIIAADNDIKPDERNTGKEKAESAATAVSGWVTLPPTNHKADWDDYRQQNGTEATTRAFTESLYQPKGAKMKPSLTLVESGKERDEPTVHPALNQMGASQRGDVLLARYSGALAIHGDSDTVHYYDGMIWKPIADKELQREMAAIYREAEISYSQPGIKSAVDTMKLSLPRMGITERHLIGFTNGVFDTKAGEFRPHRQEDWLLIASGVEFNQAHAGEALDSHAPNFWKWLTRSTGGNTRKADRVLAALYMVMANRYDWQLFLEVTGPGGSGKSVFSEVCIMLAGKGNAVAASMSSLENPKERELIVGASLIVLSDMARYAGDGAGIKAITGGDKVAVDPKYKAPYSMRIPAVVLAVNNNSMTFSDRSGGISRRRVIFNFADVVPDGERDLRLPEKIEAELAIIIRHLLTRFTDQQQAKQLLQEQRQSEEALAIKREGDSLVDFCGYLMALVECEGMFIGNAEIIPFAPRRYLYHAYMAYMSAHGLGKPVSLTRFGKDMPGSMAEYSKEYKKERATRGPSKGNYQSNVSLLEDANEWLPAATGGEQGG